MEVSHDVVEMALGVVIIVSRSCLSFQAGCRQMVTTLQLTLCQDHILTCSSDHQGPHGMTMPCYALVCHAMTCRDMA